MTTWECGVDEAGRGPLAGPVCAAAVILDPDRPIQGLADSKKLSGSRREELRLAIQERSVAYSVAWASVEEIDCMNILQATLLAMRRAIDGLVVQPTLALIDGNRTPELMIAARAIVKGDVTVPAISAASILAKTARDKVMCDLHLLYPDFGFDQHKGYGTVAHLRALSINGPTPVHRLSFAPVRNAIMVMQSSS